MNANTLITQVQKNDNNLQRNGHKNVNNKVKKKSIFNFFCCCFQTPEATLLLPPIKRNKKTLVLDLDETLVHSSFKPVPNADFIVPVEIEDQVHQVYVLKRPHVDSFMKRMGDLYEIVVFTASLAKYADPVLDLLDKHKVVNERLFREACVNHKGNYVKDLGRMGRDIKRIIIIDNSPASYMFNPENAVPVESWFDDETDTELLDLIPTLEHLAKASDVRDEISKHQKTNWGSSSFKN